MTPKRIGRAIEPISIAECRQHLRIEFEGVDSPIDSPATYPEDPLIAGLLGAARQWAENFTEQTIALQTFEIAAHGFPTWGSIHWPITSPYWTDPSRFGSACIQLPGPPLVNVLSILFTDPTGATQQLDPAIYRVDVDDGLGVISLRPGTAWPATVCDRGAVRIRYRAGYAPVGTDSPYGVDSPVDSPYQEHESLPPAMRAAILLVLGHLYENRESVVIGEQPFSVPMGAESLLIAFRRNVGL